MKMRRLAVAAGTSAVLLAAGCGSSVAGQAQIASGAVVPTTSHSAPSPFPDPSTGGSGTSESSSTTSSTKDTGGSGSTDEPTTAGTAMTDTTESSETIGSATVSEDTSVGPTPATSIPGLSKDCSAVLAGITAFGKLLQTAGADDSISQAAVDEALRQLPESGLPARPQADITVLRTTVSGAAGKTLTDFSQALTDGRVVDALKDLSSWTQSNCG